MDYLKNRFLSEMGRAQIESKGSYVCGDCKYFRKEKCPIEVKYNIANICYFYKPSKKQKKFFMKNLTKKNNKIDSFTLNEKQKKRRKKKKIGNPTQSKKIFTDDGFVRCNLRYGFKVKEFLEKIIKEKEWKCERRRCKDRQRFVVRAKHPTKKITVSENSIYKITDTFIEMKLACPSCNFLHTFPKDVSNEIREFFKTLTDENIFVSSPDSQEEIRMIVNYVSRSVFLDGYEDDPLCFVHKNTIAYKQFKRKIRKIAKDNDVKPVKVIGIVFNNIKGCIVLENATFIIISGKNFSFAA